MIDEVEPARLVHLPCCHPHTYMGDVNLEILVRGRRQKEVQGLPQLGRVTMLFFINPVPLDIPPIVLS